MKIKINKKSQKEIAKLQKIIEKHRVEEDNFVKRIITSMHLQSDEETEVIWDYIYNNSDWMVELEK